VWARVWARTRVSLYIGTRVSLYVGLLAALLDLCVGVTYGAISGFVAGRVDDVMQRVFEVLNGIPGLVVAILAVIIFKPGIITIFAEVFLRAS